MDIWRDESPKRWIYGEMNLQRVKRWISQEMNLWRDGSPKRWILGEMDLWRDESLQTSISNERRINASKLGDDVMRGDN